MSVRLADPGTFAGYEGLGRRRFPLDAFRALSQRFIDAKAHYHKAHFTEQSGFVGKREMRCS